MLRLLSSIYGDLTVVIPVVFLLSPHSTAVIPHH